ncbi:hypothetical protein ARMSODRAFT_169615 [Armillaria solidipes]|uniref:Uncharacterized protein n=1 Tax=Armillaria solidipes TaxID=1076256 RepID=A0A2H3B0V1_9AGAR|nr:hypothetical protein ARMSODRAFT_169615 [Armillaria solidipes]
MDSSTSSLTVTATSSMLFMVSPHALDLDASVSNSCLPTTTNGFSDAVRSILTRARICFEGRQSTRRRRRRWERRRFAIWTLIWQRRRKSCDERTIGGTLKGSSTLDGLRFGPPHGLRRRRFAGWIRSVEGGGLTGSRRGCEGRWGAA